MKGILSKQSKLSVEITVWENLRRMDKIENFLKEPSMEKLERLRKSERVKIGEKFELNVQNTMRKHELVRKIAEHMVDENVFEEAALEELPTEIIRMTPEQIELEKIKIQAQMELQRNKMELEKAKIQQETRLREVDLAISRREGSHDSFEVTKQARLVPKFEEANVDEYFAHFERTALNLGWPREFLVNATLDCTDRKSTEIICNSADRKLARLLFGESSGSKKLRVRSRSL